MVFLAIQKELLLYHRFVLSKIPWHITIANSGKKWVVENIDNLITSYIRQWLELPISATLSTLILPKSKYRINCILPSSKFLQYQTVTGKALKSSRNSDINLLWAIELILCLLQELILCILCKLVYSKMQSSII